MKDDPITNCILCEAEGVDSITSFLLTLLPKDRSSNLTQKWLKNSVRFSEEN